MCINKTDFFLTKYNYCDEIFTKCQQQLQSYLLEGEMMGERYCTHVILKLCNL